MLDSETQLAGVPKAAWDYRLGNRSALDWILDQYKEKTPKDPTIREKFTTHRFADYKEKVVDLLARVTRVSVETAAIVEGMRALPRDRDPRRRTFSPPHPALRATLSRKGERGLPPASPLSPSPLAKRRASFATL